MDGVVPRILCLLLLSRAVIAGWGAMPNDGSHHLRRKGRGLCCGPKESREEGCDDCWEFKWGRHKGSKSTQGLPQSSLPSLLFYCCLPVDLKMSRRECLENSTARIIANLKCNHHRKHCRMANLRCVDIPDSPH